MSDLLALCTHIRKQLWIEVHCDVSVDVRVYPGLDKLPCVLLVFVVKNFMFAAFKPLGHACVEDMEGAYRINWCHIVIITWEELIPNYCFPYSLVPRPLITAMDLKT